MMSYDEKEKLMYVLFGIFIIIMILGICGVKLPEGVKYEYKIVYNIHYPNTTKTYTATSNEEIEYEYSFGRYIIYAHINYIYKGKAPFEIVSYTKKRIN